MRLGRLAALTLALALVASLTGAASARDPRWVFYSKDKTYYTSPWFQGAHRIMIPFGCTPAPYYSPDPSCPDSQGFHHGIDVAIPCGTPLRAGRAATVLDHGALGLAYIPLGEFCAHEAPEVVRLDLRQAARQGILTHPWGNRPAYHFGSGVSARFHPAKHNGRSDDSRVLALDRFPLARSPSAALRVGAFVPCIPPLALLTLGVGGVPRPCYAGTGKKESLEECSSVMAFLYAGMRLACRS